MELAEVESLMYDDDDPYNGIAAASSLLYLGVRHRHPLALLARFELEIRQMQDKHLRKRESYLEAPLPCREMVRRQWEQIFSSRLPPIEKPVVIINGQVFPSPLQIEHGIGFRDSYYEELFTRQLLPALDLIGDPDDHPSRGIKVPLAIARNECWQDFVKNQAYFYKNHLGGVQNKWLPFLLTRPFVVFQVIADVEKRDRGYSRAMVAQSWRQNGYWNGGQWGEDSEEPGWTWPDENPSYFLDDFMGSWELAGQLWLGDPTGPKTRCASPPPRTITEEELAADPTLSKRQGEFVALHRRQKRKREREEAAAASAISVDNYLGDWLPAPLPPGSRSSKKKKEVNRKPARSSAPSQRCGVAKAPRKRADKVLASRVRRRKKAKQSTKEETAVEVKKTVEAVKERLESVVGGSSSSRLRRSSRLNKNAV